MINTDDGSGVPLLQQGPVHDEEWRKGGKGTVLGSAANLANAAIGAGILAFPYAFMKTGLILGSIITVVGLS